jgi:hypothetical protein
MMPRLTPGPALAAGERMLTRREFLRTSAVAAKAATVTIIVTHIGCSNSDNNNGGTTVTTSPTLPCDGAGSTSTVVSGHTHEICVPLSDLTNPPANGATYTTTFASAAGVNNHTHNLVLSQAELAALGAGSVVTMTTTISEAHEHSFTLQRATAAATTPAPTPTVGPY